MHKRVTDMNVSVTCDQVRQEAQTIVREAAHPWQPGDSVKAGIGRAARVLGLGYSRARQAWYGMPAAWRAAEIDALRARYRTSLSDRQARLRSEMERLQAAIESAADGQAGR